MVRLTSTPEVRVPRMSARPALPSMSALTQTSSGTITWVYPRPESTGSSTVEPGRKLNRRMSMVIWPAAIWYPPEGISAATTGFSLKSP